MNALKKILIKLYCGLIPNKKQRRMMREILLLKNRYDKLLELSDFKYLNFCFIDQWKKYYNENYIDIPNKLMALKSGMDVRSQAVVDLIFERNMHLACYEKHRDIILYKTNEVFKSWEVESSKEQDKQIKEFFTHMSDATEYPDLYAEKHLFITDHGLKNLSKKVHNYIANRDIIDGGAYIGDSAVIFTKYQPRKIYSFEPIKSQYERLTTIMKEKKLLNTMVVPINAGLGEKAKLETFSYRGMCPTFLIENHQDFLTETVEIKDIDTFKLENNLNVGLIKLDVEGYEYAVIQGALETIKQCRPVLLISAYHLPKDFFEIKPLIEKEAGNYHFAMVKLLPTSPTVDTMLIGYPKEIDKE